LRINCWVIREEIIKIKRLVLIGIAIAILLSASVFRVANAEKEKAAVTVAEKWLALVDTGKYSESWQESDGYFKSMIQQDQWVQSLRSVRTPLGKVISRKLEIKIYKTSLPGASDGQYVIIKYITSFQNNKHFTETVVSRLGKDERWRVLGFNFELCPHCYMKMVID
jgi:hypothetical protein